jgi:hypothetical protein
MLIMTKNKGDVERAAWCHPSFIMREKKEPVTKPTIANAMTEGRRKG